MTGAAGARPFEMQECDQIVVVLEEAFDKDGDEAASFLLPFLCEKMEEFSELFGLELERRKMLQVFIPEDMRSFNRITGRSFFTLAVYSSRRGVITQPGKALLALRSHRKLKRTLTHELVHFFVHRTIGPRCPTWLNEGLAQWYEGIRPRGRMLLTEAGIGTLERRWHTRSLSVAQRRSDYRTSLELVARLMYRVGEKKLLAALPGLRRMRDPLALEARGRTLRAWLFSADAPPIAWEDEGGIQVERGVEWTNQIAEELGKPVELPAGAKVYDFEAARKAEGRGVTPLPLDRMMKKSRESKRDKRRKQSE